MGAKVMREVRGFSLRKCLFFLLVGAVVFFTTLGMLRFYSTRLAYHLEGLNLSIKRYADEETVLRQELSALIAPNIRLLQGAPRDAEGVGGRDAAHASAPGPAARGESARVETELGPQAVLDIGEQLLSRQVRTGSSGERLTRR